MTTALCIILFIALTALSVYTWRQYVSLQAVRQKLRDQEPEFLYNKALMLTLANAAYNALIVVDKSCNIIAINTAAETLFAREGYLGKPLVEATNVPELQMMVNDALTNEENSFEEQIVIGEQNFRVQAQVIRRDGHQFIGLALQDITRLVRLNRARRDMVANISHELRTPIAKIRIIIDSLFHDQEKPKRKDSIASLRAIARETDSLLWLVQEMSDLSMIESGQAIVRMVDVLLSELVDDAIDHVQDISEHKGVILTSHIPDKITVLCDSDLARRVIVNLVHNAIKWSPEGETVTVNAENSGEEVTISVLDNGPGVAPDAIERIFERFYQVDASRSGGEGTGLGLAICRHIVEAHGGRIWAESNENGAGGRFLFTLLSANKSFEETSAEEIPVTDETSESSGKSLPEHAESVKE
jgi:two-component system phosphate regulon sensor histidine kinase PhoR